MKVENQNQAQGVQGVDTSKLQNAEIQATMLLRVLSKASEEIHEASIEAKLDSGKPEGKDSVKGEHESKVTSKNKRSNEGKILESFITSLNMDLEVHQLIQETVKTLLTKSKQMLKDFNGLQAQIEEVSNKLNDMMSKKMIDQITDLVKQMIDRAIKAFAKEKKALDGAAEGEDTQGLLDEALSEIANIISTAQNLISEAPTIKNDLLKFIEAIQTRGPVATFGDKILEKLADLDQERTSLENELAKLVEAQNSLAHELMRVTSDLKELLNSINLDLSSEISEKNLKDVIESISEQIKKSIEGKANESKEYTDVKANNFMVNPESQSKQVFG